MHRLQINRNYEPYVEEGKWELEFMNKMRDFKRLKNAQLAIL